jgi:hypothetical protein
MADYYTLLTNAGLAYETACKAAGVPIKLSKMSVGDGNGAVYNPDATATALRREVWRGDLNALFQDASNSNWLLAEVTIPPEVGGWYVREAAIWTDTGILYAVVKYPESYKPVLATSGSGKEFYIRSIFETSNAAIVTLLIDDTVVKATRAWVTSYLAAELAKLDNKQSVRVATTANIVLSGAQVIDAVAVVAGDRVLVKDQVVAKDNGIYIVANGAWSRALDADASIEVTPGLFVPVELGGVNAGSMWQLVSPGPIVLGTTALLFEMSSGRSVVAAGTYKSVTVDKRGVVIGGTNPTTLAGFGITDASTPLLATVNLVVMNTPASPTTKVDITADEVILKNAAGEPKTIKGVVVQADINASGVGGLDTGAKAATTWYAIWLISNAAGAVYALLSTSFTAPVLPAGYTHKLLVSAVRLGTGSTMVKFWQYQNKVSTQVQNILNNAASPSAGVFVALAVSPIIPPNARKVTGLFGSCLTNAGSGWVSVAADQSGLGQQTFNGMQHTIAAFGYSAVGGFEVGISTPQTLYWTQGVNSSPTARIDITGYEF